MTHATTTFYVKFNKNLAKKSFLGIPTGFF